MPNTVILSAARTPVGKLGGGLSSLPATKLGAIAIEAALERAGTAPDQVDHVVFGNVIHTAPEDMYMARVVGIKAGIPKETPAYTVNRLCGTGVQSIVSAAQAIQTGDASVAVAGGAESMSRGPYWVPQGRWGARMGEAAMVDPVRETWSASTPPNQPASDSSSPPRSTSSGFTTDVGASSR